MLLWDGWIGSVPFAKSHFFRSGAARPKPAANACQAFLKHWLLSLRLWSRVCVKMSRLLNRKSSMLCRVI